MLLSIHRLSWKLWLSVVYSTTVWLVASYRCIIKDVRTGHHVINFSILSPGCPFPPAVPVLVTLTLLRILRVTPPVESWNSKPSGLTSLLLLQSPSNGKWTSPGYFSTLSYFKGENLNLKERLRFSLVLDANSVLH